MDFRTRRTVLRLAAESGAPIMTVRRWLAGEQIRHAERRLRIEQAAARLGVAQPAPTLGNSPPPAAA